MLTKAQKAINVANAITDRILFPAYPTSCYNVDKIMGAIGTLIKDKQQQKDIVAQMQSAVNKAITNVMTSVYSAKKQAPSRSERFESAKSLVSDGKAQMEELRDELQSWRDNLPENLQDGEKANELDDAIGNLESAISQAEDVEGTDVEFPRMF